MAETRFYTVGHSTRTIDEFVALLTEHSIEQVIDVRKIPGSNRYPQFNEAPLTESLGNAGVQLLRLEGLTGRRPVSKVVPFEVNAWWQNRSFHNYADHALSAEFQRDLAELLSLSTEHATAVMCSEAVWWRCHRRIIADYAIARGCNVTHILAAGKTEPAKLSEGAVVGDGAAVLDAAGEGERTAGGREIRVTYPAGRR